ncbi:MAG TPA: carboxypeptidase regulatory-like domain-containing protein [Candidatus Dormibacteraeota bacterium]|nr:carboxypeptidase regulatory-like domain-containing protein [Candidatus Dormibacteraeota bacterium]
MTSSYTRAIVIVLGSLLLVSVSSFGQFDSGQIAGFVHDVSGSVVAGAKVIATNEGNAEEHHATTNESGHYIFPNLVVGLYTISVEAEGFNKFVQKSVKLSSADRLSLDIELTVGTVLQSVEIQGSAARVQTESAQVSRTIENRQIQDLTLNGRNPIFLALLKPGVRGGSIGAFQPDDVTNGGFSINGGRADEYVVMVDGAIATRTRSSGSMLGAQNVDTIQEVQILTANYSAEYGRSSAGQIRFVTKSGTQHFHGDLIENFRNSWLDANSWLRNHSPRASEASAPAAFRFNQYGFDVGGPIFIPAKFNSNRSKLFFFVAEEWIARREERTTTATVPSLAMRGGDFSELLNGSNKFFGKARFIKDPSKAGSCNAPGDAACFPGNKITGNRPDGTPWLSPNGLALLNAYPQPTPGFQQGSDNWIGTEHAWSDLRKDTIKIDYLASERHRISFRATHIPWRFDDPLVGLTRMQELWSRPNSTGVISLTSTISPTLINEFTFSANSDGKGTIFEDPACGARCRRSTYSIKYPFLFPGTKWFPEKLPTIRMDGLSTLDAGPYPGTWAGFVYAWANNTTKIVKNHMVKWGIFIERSGQNDVIQLTTATPPATNNQNGAFRFFDSRSGGTGLGLGNAALGLFNDYSEFGTKPETPWVATGVDLFIQDNWKATKKLTVEAGVRWAYWPPWHSRWGSIAMFDPDFYDPAKAAVVDPKAGFIVSGDPFNGIVLPGNGPPSAEGGRFLVLHNGEFTRLYHGLPDGFSQTHWNVFQPRLGLAYAFNSKTALRTGVGAFANRTMINRDTALGGNAPFMPQQTVVNGSADVPAGAQKPVFPFNMTIQDLVLKIPVAWNWNATFQRELPWATNVEVAYVGRLGLHNQRKRNINQLLPGTCANSLCPLIDPSKPTAGRFDPTFLRPFRGMGIIGISENSGRSIYHGLQVSVERRFSSGLQFGVAYTLSRVNDNSSDLTDTLPNAYDDRPYWGVSDLDRTHVLILNYIYELPFLKGSSSLLRRLAGNWEISGINQFQSGGPFSVRTGDDFAGVGPGSGAQFWNQVASADVARTSFTSSATWFNKNAFAQPAPGTFGAQKRNGLRNPGFWSWDLGIRKNFPVTEIQRLQFRLEVFNLLNHPNWGGANNNPKSGSFGQVTSKSDQSRKLQLALKYIF